MRRRRAKLAGAARGAAGVLCLLAAASSEAQQDVSAAAAPAAPAKPPSAIMRWLDPATAPFIPIPEIDVDPQSGVTVGLIAAFLRVNERGELERITAPDLFHSQYFGWGAGISLYGFPSEDS